MSISVQNLNKRFGATVACDRLNIEIPSGELVALLGPSGCGKTTLLRIIAGLEIPDSGSVLFHGDDATDVHVRDRNVGFVFQHYNLFPTLRAWENVAVALDLKGLAPASQREEALALLERLGLDDRATHFPSELSGGQKQRVAIARALAGTPGLILADEPTAALDSRTGQDVVATLRDLAHNDGCAVVIVSHDPRVERFADRVLHLEDGRVLDDRRTHPNEAS